jgi:hypothetical protein
MDAKENWRIFTVIKLAHDPMKLEWNRRRYRAQGERRSLVIFLEDVM